MNISRIINFLNQRRNYFKCRLFPQTLVECMHQVKEGHAVWTPDGIGYYKAYNKYSNLVDVYLKRHSFRREYSPSKLFRIVGYVPKVKQLVPLSTDDYKYLIMKTELSRTLMKVRLTTHGNLTFHDDEKEKRKMIAIFNSHSKTTGRNLMLHMLSQNINLLIKNK